MPVEIRHNPSFAVARVTLAPGEPLQVEAGAMAAMSPDLNVQAQMQGGLMKSLARGALGGESLFITTYTAGQYGGWVDVAPNLPGDVVALPGVSTRRMGGSSMTALKSGEGLVFEFTGPGEVLGQSRNPAGLVSYLAARGLGARS